MTGFKTLVPGERVEVEFYRANQESYRYLAKRVRRLDAPAPERDRASEAGYGADKREIIGGIAIGCL